MKTSVRVPALLAAASLAVIALIALRPEKREAGAALRTEPSKTRVSAAVVPLAESLEVDRVAEGLTTFIDDVDVDRRSVCAGEAVVVTVRARDRRTPPSPLTTRIQGRFGSPAAVVLDEPGDANVEILVSARDHALDRRRVAVHVRDCGDTIAPIAVAVQPVAPDRHRFVARAPAGARMYRWDFGDGTTATGPEPVADHVFPAPASGEQESHFVVRVVADLAAGGQATGHANVARTNVNEINKAVAGVVAARVDVDAVTREASRIAAVLTVQNPEPTTGSVRDAEVTFEACDERTAPLARRRISARDVLDVTEFGPGKTRSRISLPDPPPDTCRAFVRAEGSTGTSPAFAFVVDVGLSLARPKVTTLDASARARAVRALAVLGRDPAADGGATITEDEMQALEARGLLP